MTASLPPLTLCELEDPGVPGLESYSPFCLKAHRALRAAGLSYERRHASNPGVFREYNPARQVPILLVGDEPVADSTEILRRIEALVPGSLVPSDPRTAAEAWLLEDFADTSLNGFLVAARWADERNWPGVKQAYFKAMPSLVRAVIPGRIRKRVVGNLVARDVWRAGPERCWARFQATLDNLDTRAPAQGFWMGERISVADVALFGQLHGLRSVLTPWQSAEVEKRRALSAYLDRVGERTRAEAAHPAREAARAA